MNVPRSAGEVDVPLAAGRPAFAPPFHRANHLGHVTRQRERDRVGRLDGGIAAKKSRHAIRRQQPRAGTETDGEYRAVAERRHEDVMNPGNPL